MITAFAATINGGKLLQPYVVQTVTAADGTGVENPEPTVVRQVGSQETSDKCREILTSVGMAEKGTGKNARQAGYTIGGKTGTSETTVPGEVVVSSRNYVTNRALEEAGIRLHTIPSAELTRGRGGPRCMSMPLWREDP